MNKILRWTNELGLKNQKLGMPYKVISYKPKFKNNCKHHKLSFYGHVDWEYNDRVYDLYFLSFEENYTFGSWEWCARYDDLDHSYCSGFVSSMVEDADFMRWFIDYQDQLGRRLNKEVLIKSRKNV